LRDNVVRYSRGARPHISIWRIHIAHWIPKAVNTPQNIQYFHYISICMNTSYCVVICKLPVLCKVILLSVPV
jgi:hypothetical protein